MLPSADPRTNAFPHGSPYVALAETLTRHSEPPPPVDHVAQRSAVADHLLALQGCHREDRRLHHRAGEDAVEDRTGSRCRSYRAAIYFLQGLSRIELTSSDGAEALR